MLAKNQIRQKLPVHKTHTHRRGSSNNSSLNISPKRTTNNQRQANWTVEPANNAQWAQWFRRWVP